MTPSETPDETRGALPPLFDAHLHIADPRFALVPNAGYVPPPFAPDAYRAAVAGLGVVGGAVVAGSFQSADPAWLLDALAALGPAFVGVTRADDAPVTDAEIAALDRAGVRAVRLTLHRGAALRDAARLARQVWDAAGWHVEVYADGAALAAAEPVLAQMPRVVVDHLGLTPDALPVLRRLLAAGGAVKATGFGRLAFDPAPVVADLAAHGTVVVGTDLPSTRAPRPFRPADLAAVADALGPERARRAFLDDAVALYRPAAPVTG